MEKFKGQEIISFFDRFKTDRDCLEYLASVKWTEDYVCPHCGHTKYIVRKGNFARCCNRCHHIESPTANTLFHKVKFGIRKAFLIVFEMSTTTKGMSARQLSKFVGVSRPTAWLFMQKVHLAMKSSEQYPMVGKVTVDEFVYGGKEEHKQGRSTDSKKKKIVAAVEKSETGGIQRVYFQKIDNYSSSSLGQIFEKHIDHSAQVTTDKWTGYVPLKQTFNITQYKSDKGSPFFEMNTIVHQVKTWLRCTYSWIHEQHIEKYLDEFCYRINRSIYKQTIFDGVICRMVKSQHIGLSQIKIRV